jgi:hypothetical protein
MSNQLYSIRFNRFRPGQFSVIVIMIVIVIVMLSKNRSSQSFQWKWIRKQRQSNEMQWIEWLKAYQSLKSNDVISEWDRNHHKLSMFSTFHQFLNSSIDQSSLSRISNYDFIVRFGLRKTFSWISKLQRLISRSFHQYIDKYGSITITIKWMKWLNNSKQLKIENNVSISKALSSNSKSHHWRWRNSG